MILGCTHYPLLRREIGAIFQSAKLVDSFGRGRRRRTGKVGSGLANGGKPGLEVVVTDRTEHFERLAKQNNRKKNKTKSDLPGKIIYG